MKKLLISIIVLIGMHLSVHAQNKDSINKADTIKYWTVKNAVLFTFGQSSYKYWVKGGENSVSGIANYKFTAFYKKDKSSWENTIELAYGLVQQGTKKSYKTDDKIELTSNYGYSSGGNWYYSGLVNFKTQFSYGYKSADDVVPVSNFMAPAYLITSIGMEYKKPDFNLMLSALTGKTTFVFDPALSDIGAFGVDKGKKLKAGVGSYLRMTFRKELMTNMELNNKLELYSDYFDHPEEVVVINEFAIKMKINKYFSTNLAFNLIYDHNSKYVTKDAAGNILSSEAKLQLKEVFGLALNFTF
ncbi:MAG: DUF3078 domain-containing protein [Bacteroidetes bacterium]|nr:DUF3078 domain-containing protein [Bacteroidota bacterium]